MYILVEEKIIGLIISLFCWQWRKTAFLTKFSVKKGINSRIMFYICIKEKRAALFRDWKTHQ